MQSDTASQLENHLGNAMREAVRHILKHIASDGLPGNYHLYITFATGHPGVIVSKPISAQYPDEMTIVLQNIFWGLEVESDAFEVTLSFSGQSERLRIPFTAITGFADTASAFRIRAPETEPGHPAEAADPAESEAPPSDPDAKVVTLESMRKRRT